ncbi:hypothetical protein VE03_02596 [Pseudogymnoascus sp. 23342-1-I1]|nr:hypothetical protein VE03_02596 [Pseudogymnoascus sp. 23342-1-I1]
MMQILALLPIVAIVAAHNNPEQPEYADPVISVTYTNPSQVPEGTASTIYTNPTRSAEESTYTTIYTNPTRGPEDGLQTTALTNPSQPPRGSTVTVYVTACPVYPNSTFTRGPVPPTPTGGGPGPTSPPGTGGPQPNRAAATSYMGASVLVGLAGVVVLAGLF